MTEFEENKIKSSRHISSKYNNIVFTRTIYRILHIERLIDSLTAKMFSMVKPMLFPYTISIRYLYTISALGLRDGWGDMAFTWIPSNKLNWATNLKS